MGRGQELLDAAREGDRKTVEKIIGQITKRSGPFPSIRRGPGVNVQDDNGYTPLHHACLNGHKEIVQLLLNAEALPYTPDKRGATPLHLAAFKGLTDVARILLAHKNPPVNIDHLTLNHETALLIAAHFGFDEFVALLISYGADVTIRNINDESALDLAAQYGRVKTVKYLLRVRPQLVEQYRASPNRETIYFSSTTTPLHRAAKHGHLEVVIALIEAGVDPNIRTDTGTALHEAACFARADVVRELLRRGVDLKARDKRGKTIYDLLTAYPEEATRKVREVIREFVSQKSSYDSEEDLPPFPVGHDYSPTAHVSNLPKESTSSSLGTNINNMREMNKFQEKEVTNAYNKSLTMSEKSSKKYTSDDSITSELIARTDSFLTKQKIIKKLVSDTDTRGKELIVSKVFLMHCEVLSELKNLQLNITKDAKLNPKSNKILGSNVFQRISSIWPDLDSDASRSNRLNSVDKKKPLPSPKPKIKLKKINQDEVDKPILDNNYSQFGKNIKTMHLSTTPIAHVFEEEGIYANTHPEDIYQNLNDFQNKPEEVYVNLRDNNKFANMPDDVKANIPNEISEDHYLPMDLSLKNRTTALETKANRMSSNLYESMDPLDKMPVFGYVSNICNQRENRYLTMNPSGKPDPAFATNINNESNNLYASMDQSVKMTLSDFKAQGSNEQENHYLEMNKSTKPSNKPNNSDVLKKSCTLKPRKISDNTYLSMKALSRCDKMKSGLSTRSSVKTSLSLSADYINYDATLELRCKNKNKYGRMNSIPDCFYFGVDSKPYSVHTRGIPGCLFEKIDHDYIYELNQKTIRGDDPPFIKKKVTQSNVPCYCKDLSDYQDIEAMYYSCEDTSQSSYVVDINNPSKNMKIKEFVENVSFKRLGPETNSDPHSDQKETQKKIGIFKKKIEQLKLVITDWMAPETQKMSNKNDSLLYPSSSSLTKNHPQSFVKMLASKCLGLKAKFNSAPNISNNATSESEVDVTSKLTNSKAHTNTLLIGNSKFFKILSKKEESGDIACNDEFDTISLDRLGTLNRDSVVNRSNRSCPGFKTSLPNISENNELSDPESISESVVITELDCDTCDIKPTTIIEAINYNKGLNIFEPRERTSIISNVSCGSTHLINECYESYEFHKNDHILQNNSFPRPYPRPNVLKNDDSMIYENVISLKPKPTPATRTHIPLKLPLDEIETKVLYENVSILKKPEAPKRTILPSLSSSSDKDNTRSVSRSSTLSSDSMVDETNLEDIFLSQKSKSFKHGQVLSYSLDSYKTEVRRTQSTASDSSDATEASAIENVDCSDVLDEKALYLSMTGTLPINKTNREKKKVLFRHKTFTNMEVDRNSVKVKDLPQWNNEFLKDTLAHYHIRGTGHCIYNAPTVQEFLYIFNRDTLYKDVPPFTKVPNEKRDSYFETAICFCKPRPPKHHSSAEDLLERTLPDVEESVSIDLDALKIRREILSTSFKCFCDSGKCALHSNRRESINDLVVKFSAIKRSISTPDITLNPFSTVPRTGLPKNNSVPYNLEEPYAVVSVEDIIQRNEPSKQNENGETYSIMSHHSSLSSSTSRMYSIKDIAEVISLNQSSSTASTLSNASDMHLPVRKSSSSEYSGHWSLQSCNSNVTIKSDASFKTCLEESSDEDSDGTLHSDDYSDTETIKSDISTVKRPWVHSDSFRFGSNTRADIETIVEESQSSFEDKFESMSSKFESGISVEGSESSSSGCEDDSGVPRGRDMSLDASLERGSVSGGVRSGSGRPRWDEMEGTSEGDALSLSSAASSCAPLHLAHHHDYSKVSPTPPKKPPRRNLSVSPTHANSPSSGYSYELRVHARSQDDLDDIQGAKHYLKHGRSVDHYVDSKLSYSEYEENHHSPRVAPIPTPRPSLKQRSQPVAITAMYENVVIKEQNPRRKLRRNNYTDSDPRMAARKYSHQERSSLESLLDDQSMNSPSDCERYYDGPRVNIPLSPTHYEQPPTPEHPPPSARQAENSIHERIRPLSQEYKRRSQLRDSYTETEVNLLRAASAASVASGATDRSGKSDNWVEEYVCDVPFAGLFKGSTTTLDGIGLRPMPAERPKTLRKLKSVYDSSPTELPHSVSNGVERNVNGVEEEVRRRSNTTSSTQSADKSLSILSPFDEQEEWAKISEIMASFGSKLVRESVFVSELEQEFTSRLGLSCSESSLSPSVASNLGLWLSGMGLHDYETLFLESGYDDIDFFNGILDENDLREMGIEEADRHKIIESSKQLPLKITDISNNHNNNNISNKHQNESVDEWLRQINLEQYSDTFRKHLYVDMDRVRRIWEVELTAVLEIQKAGHRKRILASVSGEHNGPINHMEDINADLHTLKNNINQLKEVIKEKLPPSENLKPVPPPVVPTLAPPGGETLKRSKKNRPAPQPPRPSDLEIRAPSELLVGVPGALKTQWKHQPFVLVTGAVTYVANYLGSTVVKELRGTESTKKSIQKLKKTTKEPRDSPDIILSISYRGVKFLNTITRELICEHEIRNIHCACQDADDLTHFAYITKDHATRSHYCHVFRVATMDQATEVILTLGEAFEVAYQMALREQSNRTRVTQSLAKTPTHDPMTTSNKEKPNVNHGRSHSITEIKLNGHQLKVAPLPASLSNEDFQTATRNSDGSRSPRTPLLKAPIASTEEL